MTRIECMYIYNFIEMPQYWTHNFRIDYRRVNRTMFLFTAILINIEMHVWGMGDTTITVDSEEQCQTRDYL